MMHNASGGFVYEYQQVEERPLYFYNFSSKKVTELAMESMSVTK